MLTRLASYDRLEALIARDETIHQIFRTAGATNAQICLCPGFFAFPDPRLRREERVVALDLLDPKTLERDSLYARRPKAQTSIAFGLAHPATQRLRRAADPRRDRADRCTLRAMLALPVRTQPSHPIAQFM